MIQIERLSEDTIELRDSSSKLPFWLQLRSFLAYHLVNIEEVLNTEDSVVIIFQAANFVHYESVYNVINQFSFSEELADSRSTTHTVEVNYTSEGTDLEEVLHQLKLSFEELVELHTKCRYRIAMFGFIPGFVYLTGIDSQLQLPRKSNPSLRVKSGSVAIAQKYTSIYPLDTQGGWHVIGFTQKSFLDTVLNGSEDVQPGDYVKFVQGD